MATPQELLDEQKQKELDAKVDQAAKDVKTRETKENEDVVKAMKAIPKKIVDKVKKVFKSGGMIKSSASKRADGIAVKGKTRGKIC
jgi:Skp family chaperone for outer membrane proteins